MTIGFIGLGIMGSRMAAHLLDAGHTLIVYNRTKSKADELIARGARWADTPAQVAQGCDILFTMLAHPEAVEQTALGPDGFLPAMKEGMLWVDSSTVNPSFSRRMASEATARGIRSVDAPVAGSKKQAQAAVLTFFAGGAEADIEECRPLFEVMSQKIVHAGARGMGVSMKMIINHMLSISMAAFSEALVLGEGLGFSRNMLLETLLANPMVPPYLVNKKEKLANAEYSPEFPMKWMTKDLHLVAQAAYECNTAMPLSNAAKVLYQQAVQHGMGDYDFSAIYSFLNEGAGTKER